MANYSTTGIALTDSSGAAIRTQHHKADEHSLVVLITTPNTRAMKLLAMDAAANFGVLSRCRNNAFHSLECVGFLWIGGYAPEKGEIATITKDTTILSQALFRKKRGKLHAISRAKKERRTKYLARCPKWKRQTKSCHILT